MGRYAYNRTHCNEEGCDKPVHVNPGGSKEAKCTECRRAQRNVTQKRYHERTGVGLRGDEEGTIMSLIAFPEPEKYLALIVDITERSHEDHRTIEHRSAMSMAGPLGRAKLAGD